MDVSPMDTCKKYHPFFQSSDRLSLQCPQILMAKRNPVLGMPALSRSMCLAETLLDLHPGQLLDERSTRTG